MNAIGEALGALAQLGALATFIILTCAVDGIVRDLRAKSRHTR